MDDQPVTEGLAGLLAEFRFLHARANRCRGTVSGLLAQRRLLPEIWDRGWFLLADAASFCVVPS